ncbi:MAG TPA: DUF2231 domain-containing protein [Actinomycetota bacterium]|nr:DUF2231 domain-containing protein [Actinomycetota bacterium]
MGRYFSIKPGITLKGRKFKGLRGWAGKPFHPPLTDVPIGAYTLAAAFDFISWVMGPTEYHDVIVPGDPLLRATSYDVPSDLYRAATFCLIAGAIASIPTALTGFWDWWKSTPRGTQAWRTANWHMAIMLTAQVLVIALIVFRLSIDVQPNTSFALMAFSVAIFGLVAFGATYGGSMVYDYAFNVEQDIDYAWEERESDVLPGKDKPVEDSTS